MDHLELTSRIVAAFVTRNALPAQDLPRLIADVHGALTAPGGQGEEAPQARRATPAQIKRSITHEALISFEDGKPYKMLRRHLSTMGLTPEDYRSKWGLPLDYPMTAPAYTEVRRAAAQALGLGKTTRWKPRSS